MISLLATLALLLVAATFYLQSEGSSHPSAADDEGGEAKAVLKDADGNRIGTVKFDDDDDGIHVKVHVDAPLSALSAGFHGFHVHAVGECVAPFTSAGGHFNPGGASHPHHAADMPVLLVNADGTAEARFVSDRFTVDQIVGRAVIIHAKPDNYANIPTDRYDPDPDAMTLATGDAGARQACGLIKVD
jgi:Cu-Zn family superoxide dismutase